MKPVFKCDYCSFMGTEQEVKEHEVKCVDNYTRRSCHTCKHKQMKSMMQYACAKGMDILESQLSEFCSKYERGEKSDNTWNDLIDAMFGGARK